jgi:hypothetical protein
MYRVNRTLPLTAHLRLTSVASVRQHFYRMGCVLTLRFHSLRSEARRILALLLGKMQ